MAGGSGIGMVPFLFSFPEVGHTSGASPAAPVIFGRDSDGKS
ncbi:hypothetical protein ASZ90_015464 [hydrocarbon metagenome]|uniref:Uncharacterized protein n=1 Tax=hydrocarbon metagenome TaxID=938273 RepID=A0A0W8F1W2_9ZZZZ